MNDNVNNVKGNNNQVNAGSGIVEKMIKNMKQEGIVAAKYSLDK
jgi:hypothetical protein